MSAARSPSLDPPRTPADPDRAEIPLQSRSDALVASAVAHDIAHRRGLARAIRHRLALVTGELATNVLKHGQGGSIEIRLAHDRVQVRAFDHGPGLPNALVLDAAATFDRVVGPFPGGWGLEVIARATDVLKSGRDPDGRAWIEATLFIEGGAR
jgi:anti-sigma regulatory factor (Ser/Thr protein kinase)